MSNLSATQTYRRGMYHRLNTTQVRLATRTSLLGQIYRDFSNIAGSGGSVHRKANLSPALEMLLNLKHQQALSGSHKHGKNSNS